ncbi:MAG TPA: sodium:proton exchanger [Planctomycetaceae bacterium]|nr:sodium:proton exchanger [Planctomycetaceae bacterium]
MMSETLLIQRLLFDLLIILTAGFIAGVVCKRFGFPMVVGHLVIGALIGPGVIGILSPTPSVAPSAEIIATGEPDISRTDSVALVSQSLVSETSHGTERHEEETNSLETDGLETNVLEHPERFEHEILEGFALLGANLMLFAIGIHFSPSELGRIWKFFLFGGLIQMLGVIVPTWLIFAFFMDDWKLGLMIGSAVSLSSTVLVFKSLEDFGQSSSPHGIRAVAILLFQDVAIVPLLVLFGLLSTLDAGGIPGSETGGAAFSGALAAIRTLLIKSAIFVVIVLVIRHSFCRWGVRFLLTLKSVELLVLFTMLLLIGIITIACRLELPSALGALACGFVLSETRLTKQVTAVTIPMRETFAAIFFVSLGALFDPRILLSMPLETLGMLLVCIFGKTLSAAVAFRVLGLNWLPSLGMGLGLSQLGELSFVLLSQGVTSGIIGSATYQQVLFVALTTIILTPMFLRVALTWAAPHLLSPGKHETVALAYPDDRQQKAVVIGLGPVGARIASFLEMSGFDVCLLDMNPVNLHPYAQQGFRTVSGDAADPGILALTTIRECSLVVITVPNDLIALDILREAREIRPDAIYMVRCRYSINVTTIESCGGNLVVCEETEAGTAIMESLSRLLSTS